MTAHIILALAATLATIAASWHAMRELGASAAVPWLEVCVALAAITITGGYWLWIGGIT